MNDLRRVLPRLIRVAVALALLAVFGFYVWPTLYRYDHVSFDGSTYPVRINRLNGDADMLIPNEGWVPVEGTEQPGTQENT